MPYAEVSTQYVARSFMIVVDQFGQVMSLLLKVMSKYCCLFIWPVIVGCDDKHFGVLFVWAVTSASSPIAMITEHINWRYINHLNDVQKKDGLHAANKITDKPVNFEYHMMRVSLAAQTLSCSVSVALCTMRDLGYSQFEKRCNGRIH